MAPSLSMISLKEHDDFKKKSCLLLVIQVDFLKESHVRRSPVQSEKKNCKIVGCPKHSVVISNASTTTPILVCVVRPAAGWFSCKAHRYWCGRSEVRFPGRSNWTQRRQQLATTATFVRSCVAQALGHGDRPRHSLPYTLRRNTVSIQ